MKKLLTYESRVENQIIIKKTVEKGQEKQNNFNIYNVVFFKKNKEKHLLISLSKS